MKPFAAALFVLALGTFMYQRYRPIRQPSETQAFHDALKDPSLNKTMDEIKKKADAMDSVQKWKSVDPAVFKKEGATTYSCASPKDHSDRIRVTFENDGVRLAVLGKRATYDITTDITTAYGTLNPSHRSGTEQRYDVLYDGFQGMSGKYTVSLLLDQDVHLGRQFGTAKLLWNRNAGGSTRANPYFCKLDMGG